MIGKKIFSENYTGTHLCETGVNHRRGKNVVIDTQEMVRARKYASATTFRNCEPCGCNDPAINNFHRSTVKSSPVGVRT